MRDLFEQLAISYRSMAVNTPKVNGVSKVKVEPKKTQKLGNNIIKIQNKNIKNIMVCY